MRSETLTGPWHVQPLATLGQYEQSLPGHWQNIPQLQNYTGGVIYSLHFPKPTWSETEQVRLRLNGVFYYTIVRLNGNEIGRRQGYFSPWETEITHLLTEDNLIEIEVTCPLEKAKQDKSMILGVFSQGHSTDTSFNPGGVWLPVELVYSGFTNFRELKLHYLDDSSRLLINVKVEGLDEGAVLALRIRPHNFAGESKQAEFSISQEEDSFEWQVGDVELWWTHDTGDPNLYSVEALLYVHGKLSDKWQFRYGFRTVLMDEDNTFYLNGKRLFLRGSNYLPTDAYLATTQRSVVLRDLTLAKDAHLNILRVHAHVSHPLLYELADEHGVMLWQDMPLQGLYTHSVLSQARVQLRELISLLYNHPSVVLWCMHSKPVIEADQGDTLWVRLQAVFSVAVFSWNRDVMDAELKRVAEQADMSRPVMRSSGELSLFRRPTDNHFYYGWRLGYGKRRGLEMFKQGVLRRNLSLVSEFGAQSFPNVENTKALLGSDALPLDWAYLERECTAKPTEFQHWIPVDQAANLADLVDMTQTYQAELNQYYIDNLRYLKYRPTKGILSFMLQDSSPAVSFSLVDYWREPKMSFYALKKAMSPQYIFTLLPKDLYVVGDTLKLPIFAVNDAWEGFAAAGAVIALVDAQGAIVANDRYALSLPVDCEVQCAGLFQAELVEVGEYLLKMDLVLPDRAFTNSYRIRVTGQAQ